MKLLFMVSFSVLTNMCTFCYGKHAILMHSCFVTYTLISIIIDFKDVFKRLRMPMKKYRKAIVLFSLLYQIIPTLMTIHIVNIYTMFVHLCACFMLRVFHMHYVTVVFHRMNYKDRDHWMILFVVHLLEMCTNVLLICEYNSMYVCIAIVTECVCPYVLMYIRKKSKHIVQRFIRQNSTPHINNNGRMITYSINVLNT